MYENRSVPLHETTKGGIMKKRHLVDIEPSVKLTAKTPVFTDLFSDVEYTYQLYCALHPEDSMTTRKHIGVRHREHFVNKRLGA